MLRSSSVPINLYNTLTRREEEFQPITPMMVGMYSCGPTVYNFATIGNLRAFVFADVLRRTLEANGLVVRQIMNITDVGHLTDDADGGDDKMIVAMRREGKSAWDIANFYTQAFFDDIARLNIKPAAEYPRATNHIEEQISMVKALEESGYTYRTSDGIYFDTSKLAAYGRLSGQKSGEKKAGVRVSLGEKKNATDFALWKFAAEKREMIWPSPWGDGFPGWHLECSAMSKKYLGVPFDIHTGGVDHIAVHHENEIAQTQGADGVLEANMWMHNEFLTVDGGRMGKSLGNAYTLSDLANKGFDPLALRYFFLTAHYRTKLNFTWEALAGAQSALRKLYASARSLPLVSTTAPNADFLAAINNDLNTPQALAVMWKLLDDPSVDPFDMAKQLLAMDAVLGLGLETCVGKPIEVPEDVLALGEQRETARAAKDWKRSDELRDLIAQKGFTVEDTPDGQKIS